MDSIYTQCGLSLRTTPVEGRFLKQSRSSKRPRDREEKRNNVHQTEEWNVRNFLVEQPKSAREHAEIFFEFLFFSNRCLMCVCLVLKARGVCASSLWTGKL